MNPPTEPKSALLDRAAQANVEVARLRETIKGLADEIRVQIHLGTMELKERWKKLEPLALEAEKYVDAVGDTMRETLHDRARRMRELRDHLARIRASRVVARK